LLNPIPDIAVPILKRVVQLLFPVAVLINVGINFRLLPKNPINILINPVFPVFGIVDLAS
jgi:hypothetical protein